LPPIVSVALRVGAELPLAGKAFGSSSHGKSGVVIKKAGAVGSVVVAPLAHRFTIFG
jgi:hypothetical protein